MTRPSDKLVQSLSDIHSHNINIDTREIYLHGFHDQSTEFNEADGIDFRSATTFVKNLQFLDSLKEELIIIHMQVGGGCWQNGMGMFDSVKACKSYVKIIAYAQASSMSGIFLQAADERVMMPHTHFMLHYGNDVIENNCNHIASAAKYTEHECKVMLHIFAERAIEGEFFSEKEWDEKRTARYIDDQLKKYGDWYLNAEETVYYGLADKVFM